MVVVEPIAVGLKTTVPPLCTGVEVPVLVNEYAIDAPPAVPDPLKTNVCASINRFPFVTPTAVGVKLIVNEIAAPGARVRARGGRFGRLYTELGPPIPMLVTTPVVVP